MQGQQREKTDVASELPFSTSKEEGHRDFSLPKAEQRNLLIISVFHSMCQSVAKCLSVKQSVFTGACETLCACS